MNWAIAPTAFSRMMPKEIRKAAPKLTRRDLIILAGVLHPMQLLIIVYMALSAVNAGVSGFWMLLQLILYCLFYMGLVKLYAGTTRSTCCIFIQSYGSAVGGSQQVILIFGGTFPSDSLYVRLGYHVH